MEMQAPPPPPSFTDFQFNTPVYGGYEPDLKLRTNRASAIEAAEQENLAESFIPFTEKNGMQPTTNADKSISFDLSKLFLIDDTVGEIRVWQINPADDPKQAMPLCCKGESYFNNNIFWGIFRRWKGSLYKQDYIDLLCNAWKEKYGPKKGQELCDEEVARQKSESDKVDFNVAFGAANVGVNLYAKGTAGKMAVFHPIFNDMNRVPDLIRRLFPMSTKIQTGDYTELENMYNIVRYITEYDFAALEKKLAHDPKIVANNKHFIACMMTKDKMMPLYWFTFTLRTVGQETRLLLHGFVKSILQLVFQSFDDSLKDYQTKLRGGFCLSMLMTVAACLNKYKHISKIHLQAMPGTERVLWSMKEKSKKGSPFVDFTNVKAGKDRNFVDVETKPDPDNKKKKIWHTDLPDKIIVDLEFLKFWRLFVDEKKEKAANAEAAAEGAVAQADESESVVKKAKVNEILAKYLV